MSDVGLGATLQLEIADALARIEQVGASLAAATSGIPVTLDQPDAGPITASIDDAVQAADTTVTPDAQSDGVTTSIDDAIGAADTTIPVDADTSSAATEIDALSAVSDVIVPVDADTTAADAAITATVATADTETATIVVDADTTQADAAIAQTGTTATDAASGVDTLTGSLENFKGSTSGATGIAAALGSAIGSTSATAAAGVAGVGAFVEITKGLFESGVEAIDSEQRLALATGAFGDVVNRIHVGTLNTDIKGLAEQTGSTIVPIDNAVSRIFQLGKSSGEAGGQISATADRILALAGNARVLNTGLGSTGDIANTLTNALARGGRALSAYGISLSATQINQEALTETGKQSASELTNYEKTAAAAKLATDKLGNSFKDNFAAGSNNPVIQIGAIRSEFTQLFEELGKPLVVPVIQLLRDLVPLGEGVGKSLGSIAQSVIPVATALADILGPALGIVSGLFTAIPTQAIEVVGGLGLVTAGVYGLAAALTAAADTNPLLAALQVAVGAVAIAVGVYRSITGSSQNDQLKKDIADERAALLDQQGVLQLTTKALQDYLDAKNQSSGGELAKALKDLGLSIGQVSADLASGKSAQDAFSGAQSASFVHTLEATQAYKDYAAATSALADEQLQAAVADGVLTQAQVNQAEAALGNVGAFQRLSPAIQAHTLAVDEAAAAYGPLVQEATVGSAALAAVTSESASAGSALANFAAAGAHPTSEALVTLAVQMDSANLSTKGLDNAAVALGITSAQLTGFLNGVSGAIASFTSKVVAGLPSVADAFKPVATSAKSAGGAMANTAQTALQTQHSIESAQHGIEIANRGVVDSADALVRANVGVKDSVDKLTQAQQNLQDAEQALADSRNPAKPKDVEQANINLERAQLNVTKATDSVTKAENDLNNARAGVGTISVHDAEIALQDARLSAEESTIRVSDAEDALNTVRQVGTEADKNVTAAEKAVATAHDQVKTAADGVLTAAHQVVIANRAVADSAYAAKQAQEALTLALNKPAPSGGGSAATKEASVSLGEFVKNLEASTVKTQRFVDDLKTIFHAGDTELAGEIAQAGITAIGIADSAAQGIRTGDTAIVTEAQTAVKAHNAVLDSATAFVKNEFGPAYIATTGLVANLASQAFGDNLSYSSKLKLELAQAAGVLDIGGTAIALIAGEKGNDAAVLYAKNNNIDEITLEKGLAAAQILKDNKELPASAGDLAAIASGQFHDVLAKGLPAAIHDAAVSATSAANVAEPDRLFKELGKNLTGSILAGMVDKAAVSALNDAAAGVARGAWGAAAGPKGANTGSPSKLFMALGRDMTAGLTVGLTDSAEPVVAAAEQIVRDAAASIQSILDDQTFAIGGTGGTASLRDLLSSPAVTSTASTFGSRRATVSGNAQIQVAVGPFSFDSGTTTEQAAALVRSATDSAVDAVRRRSAVFVAVQTAGQR